MQQLAARYDSDSEFEIIANTETANDADYRPGTSPQITMLTAMKAAWTHTNVVVMGNYYWEQGLLNNSLPSLKVGMGDPDCRIDGFGPTSGQLAFRGAFTDINGVVANDIRAQVPNMLGDQVVIVGETAAAKLAFCTTQKATGMNWSPISGSSYAPANWSVVYPYVEGASNALHLTYPTAY
jgi:hypothetical protein